MRKIPRRFKLHGHTIRVELVDDLEDNAGCYGRWHENRLLIELQNPETTDTAFSNLLQAFWHEVTHAVLDLGGYGDLSADERLVDLLGHGITQTLLTKRSKP